MTAAAVIASVAAGCEDPADPAHCAGTCIADPEPHCLLAGIDGMVGCPGGLVHAQAVPGAVCAGSRDGCRWRPPPMEPLDELALIDGFAVPPMSAWVVPPPAPAFAWEPPPGASFVACALFTCPPEIDNRISDDPASTLTGPSRIANAGGCVLALGATTVSPARLPIGEQLRPTGDGCAPVHRFDRVIAFVAAGCWAYNETAIIAASRLSSLKPGDLGGAVPDVPAGASCRRDGDACYDDSHASPFFGACLDGACQPRCTTADDCELASERLLGRPSGDQCQWMCRDLPSSTAGVCADGGHLVGGQATGVGGGSKRKSEQ